MLTPSKIDKCHLHGNLDEFIIYFGFYYFSTRKFTHPTLILKLAQLSLLLSTGLIPKRERVVSCQGEFIVQAFTSVPCPIHTDNSRINWILTLRYFHRWVKKISLLSTLFLIMGLSQVNGDHHDLNLKNHQKG